MMDQKQLKNILISGCHFLYKSYDHKKALKYYNEKYSISENFYIKNPNCFSMPEDIKEKFVVWRKGKIREIHFAPNGDVFRTKIGNKYPKTFYPNDFGVNVKNIK